MIERIVLKNWRSHLETELSFSAGTNALVGIMGSGKTSILDAICFALFGTFPNLQTKKLKLDDIIMKKPVEKDKAEIDLFFNSNGSLFSIKRVVEKGKGTNYSEIRQDGSLLEAPSSQRVTEIVEKLLKVNYDLFSKAIYSEQNGLDYFLTIPRGQRMKKIDELLAIDKFEKTRSSLVSLINKISERKIAKLMILEQSDERQISSLLSVLLEEIKRMEKDKEEMGKMMAQVSDERARTEAEFYKLKKVRDGIELLQREKSGIESTIDETRRLILSFEQQLEGRGKNSIEAEASSLASEIQRVEKEIKYETQNFNQISSELTELRTKMENKQEEIKKLDDDFSEKSKIKKEFESIRDRVGENIDEQLKMRKNDLMKMNEDVSELKARTFDLSEIIKHLSSPENTCPVCDSILTPERKRLLTVQKEEVKGKLESDLAYNQKKSWKLEEEVRMLEDAQKRFLVMHEKLKDFELVKKNLEYSRKSVDEMKDELLKREKSFEEIELKVDSLNSERDSLLRRRNGLELMISRLKDLEYSKARLEELGRELNEVDEKVSEEARMIEGKDVDAFENLLKEIIAKEKEIEVRISGCSQLIAEKALRVEEYERKIAELQRYKKEIAEFDRLIKNLKIFSDAVEHTQIELRTEFVEAVNYSMNKLWQNVYPYQDFVGIRLNTEEGDYVLQLQERNGRWVNVEGVASGGERSVAALALRIAFALILAPQIRWLVLDEPTANLDSKAIEDLAVTLRDRIGEFIDQVFIITHDEKLENAVTGNLYRLERQKEVDGVTKVFAI